jgi:broad specificity phosphatase PhoE
MEETTLILARHGATEHNLVRPYVLQGRRMDPPLDAVGEQQVEALTNALKNRRIDTVFSSAFLRAKQTAEMVAKSHGVASRVIESIGEIDIGVWEGLTWDQIHARWPNESKAFEEDCSKQGYLGGENYMQLRDRVVPALEALRIDFAGRTVVVIGHNGVNRAAVAHWLGIPLGYSRRIPQANGSYSIVTLRPSGGRVQTINVVEHLAGIPGLD